MNRIYLLLVLLLFAAPLAAQDDPKPTESEETGEESVEEAGIPVDFTEYLKTRNPGLDPGGDHDIFNLRDPKDRDERHEYVHAMTQLVIEYMQTLNMGSTISKLFDQYSRSEEGNQPTFKVLYAVSLLHYPPGQPNISGAQELLREAAAVGDFAYPHYLLAQFEYARFTQVANTSPKATLEHLEKALTLRPKFLRAVLLKSQVYMSAQPPKSEEVRKMIEPWTNGKLPGHPDDFEDLMRVYAASHTTDDLHAKLDKLLKSNRLTPIQRVRAHQLAGSVHLANEEVEEAIADFQASLEFIESADHPSAAIRSERSLAVCKFAQGSLLMRDDPKLEDPANKKTYDDLITAIRAHHVKCADIEKLYMPKALRGNEAKTYVLFLAQDLGKPEEALLWLGEYLDGTELSGPQRRSLLNLQANLGIIVDPTEENLIARYQNFVAADDMVNLAKSFGIARASVGNEDKHFSLNLSLNFFISQVENRLRPIVMDAAFLAADTAKQIGDEAIAKAGKAIADRFEKETEISSDEQADLVEDLCRTIRELGDRAAQERVLRHLAKLIEDTPQLTNMRMSQVLVIWKDPALLKGLVEAPRELNFLDSRKPEKVAAWMRKLADSVKKTGEQEATEKETEPAEEPGEEPDSE